ncbi:PAS domain-containing protein [Trichostrongylus colubriformis]|uniref:PAS domain-containing protein n=1 Tax=Trichostrongylus colubriformis TaxID=6319 RepID=A0AAN8IMK7_TRICO
MYFQMLTDLMSLNLHTVADGLYGTHVTWDDIEEDMQRELDTVASFGPGKSAKDVGVGNGFMSKLLLIDPDWQHVDKELPQKFVVKEEIMCQGDSIFDLVDPRDHPTVHNELNSGPQPTTSFPEERVFLCRLNLARTAKRQLQYHKFILLKGRYIHPAEYSQTLANTPEAVMCHEKEGSVLALIKMRSADGEWLWMHTVFAVRGNLCHEVQEGRRVRHVIHCYYQFLSGIEAAALQANSWIYNIRHTYPAAFPCQGSPTPDRSLSPISPVPVDSSFPQTIDQLVPFIKQEPFTPMTMIPAYGNCAQIKVEIPMKAMPHISMFTPESSSPESSASLTSALFAQPFFSGPGGSNESAMAMEDFNCILPLTLKGTLPDLRDGLDDFFREVEQPAENTRPSATASITSATTTSYSPEHANDLFKYLGPALFGGSSAQTMESFRVTNSLPNGVHCPRKRSWVV